MGLSVVVAEPNDENWKSIADGIRRQSPDASILRVKDGEQAVRFLFHRGLLTEDPETPNLVVLATSLTIISTQAVITRIREHPRTEKTPVVVVWKEAIRDPGEALDAQGRFDHQHPVLIVGVEKLRRAIEEAVERLCHTARSVRSDQSAAVDSASG
jgi:CheY-like chemotaxis protein